MDAFAKNGISVTSFAGRSYSLLPLRLQQEEDRALFEKGLFDSVDQQINPFARRHLSDKKFELLVSQGRAFFVRALDRPQTALALIAFWPGMSFDVSSFEDSLKSALFLNEYWPHNFKNCTPPDQADLLRAAAKAVFADDPEKRMISALAPPLRPLGGENQPAAVLEAAGFKPTLSPPFHHSISDLNDLGPSRGLQEWFLPAPPREPTWDETSEANQVYDRRLGYI